MRCCAVALLLAASNALHVVSNPLRLPTARSSRSIAMQFKMPWDNKGNEDKSSKKIGRLEGERPWYIPDKDSDSYAIGQNPSWKPGDEPSTEGFFDAFMQGRNFKKTLDAEKQAERAARLQAEAEAAEDEADPWADAGA